MTLQQVLSMSKFANWYVGRLQSHPMTTNMASALLLMLTGDVAAQEIERHYLHVQDSELPPNKLSFRRYGTMSPDPAVVVEQMKRKDHYCTLLKTEVSSLDYFRMATMGSWAIMSGGFFIIIFRVYERLYPPSKSPSGVAMRVASSFLLSIPVNILFFTFGTFVHHATEWWGLVEEWRYEIPDATYRQIVRQVPFDLEMFHSTVRLKIENELVRTVAASASIWIPINALNFAYVPPHLRPLTLTFFSAFWNCYLSLAQHREAKILRA